MSAFALKIPGDEYLHEWENLAGEKGEGLPAHWSPSQIKLFRKCPEQYRQSYVMGIKTPPGKALLWGRADHTAQEANYVQKIESHEDLTDDAVCDAFRGAVDVHIDEEGGPSEIDWGQQDAAKAKKEIIDDGVRLASLYHKQIAPAIQPVAVEEGIQTTLKGIPVPVSMRLDVRIAEAIIDSKTTSSSKQKVSMENLLQGRIYTAALDLPTFFHLKVKPSQPGGNIKCLHSDQKTGKPFMVSASPKVMASTLTAVRRTLAEIAWCFSTYGPDNPWPDGLAHEWACGYCGYRDKGLCSYW